MFHTPPFENHATMSPSGRLGAVTRKGNEIIPLLQEHNEENKIAVRRLFGEYLQKVEVFIESCNEKRVNESSSDLDEFNNWCMTHEKDIRIFREKVENYLSKKSSINLRDIGFDNQSIASSKVSSTSSARIKLAAQKAKLEAEKEYLAQQEILEERRRKEIFARQQEKLSAEHRQAEEEEKYALEKKRLSLAKEETEARIFEDALNSMDGGPSMLQQQEGVQLPGMSCASISQSPSLAKYNYTTVNTIVSNPSSYFPVSTQRQTDMQVIWSQTPHFYPNIISDRANVPNSFANRNAHFSNINTTSSQPNLPYMPQSRSSQQINPIISTDKLTDVLSKQNEISLSLARSQEMASLPKREVKLFNGKDVTLFPAFIQNFERIIESSCHNAQDRFYYLKQYTSEAPHELVSSCDHFDAEIAYSQAKRLLINEYGNEYKISQAYICKLEKWPVLKKEDGEALQQLHVFLLSILNFMHKMSSLNQLNSWKEILNIVKKLPYKCRERWRTLAWHLQENNSPITFNELVTFVGKQSALINQPLFGNIQDTPTSKTQNEQRVNNPKSRSLSTSTISSPQKLYCVFCKMNNHFLGECRFFNKKSLSERTDFVKSNHLCFACLQKGHSSRGCYNRLTCSKCKRKHPTCLHDENRIRQMPKQENDDHPVSDKESEPPVGALSTNLETSADEDLASGNSKSMHVNSVPKEVNERRKIACPIIPVKLRIRGKKECFKTYAALDVHSTDNFIDENILRKFNINCPKTSIVLSTMENKNAKVIVGMVYNIEISDLDGNKSVILPVTFARENWPFNKRDVPRPEEADNYPFLKAIPFQYINAEEAEVGILIGMNHPAILKPLEIVDVPNEDIYASRHLLGWALNGVVYAKNKSSSCRRTNIQEMEDVVKKMDLLYKLEFADSHLEERGKSMEDRKWESKVNSTIHLLKDNHYVIELPFRNDDITFPNNKQQVYKRFQLQLRRLLNDEHYSKDYFQFMQMMIENSFMEVVPEEEISEKLGKVWYIAHHGVYHKSKHKLRVVFDCSLNYNGTSLNNELLEGPNLINNLIGILLRFREGLVAFQGDIEKMFYQVKVPKKHANFMRFFWFANNDINKECIEYRLTRHVFGAVSSPSVANFALKKTSIDNEEYSCQARNSVLKNFYVDDYLKSVDEIEEAISLLHEVKEIVSKGGFNLTGFSSNSKEVIKSIQKEDLAASIKNLDITGDVLPPERVLGIIWNVDSDTIGFKIDVKQYITKREILSTIFSIYDPLNILSPVTTKAKHIFQETCRLKIQWDEEPPLHLLSEWKKWTQDLHLLMRYTIPRCYKPCKNIKRTEIHYFSDGSEIAYGAVAYFRFILQDGSIHCSYLFSKSRLTPINNSTLKTIPRIELNASRLSVSIKQILKNELETKPDAEFFWTDSTAVLNYIKNDTRRFQRFVSNRVATIREHTQKEQWRYIPSKQNPADYISRGMYVSQFINTDEWQNGPAFLYTDMKFWPTQVKRYEISETDPEVKMEITNITTISQEENATAKLLNSSSTWYKTKIKTAWMLRLKSNLLSKSWKVKELTIEELKLAEIVIIKHEQRKEFSSSIETIKANKPLRKCNKLIKLNPFLDENSILRVGGRIDEAKTSFSVKHPIIIPKDYHIANLLIKESHHKVGHLGRESTLSDLRKTYWIIGANVMTRKIIRNCVQCRKRHGKPSEQLMANLPEDRLRYNIPPFTNTAVDYFGPFYVKVNRKLEKRYGVVFSCLSSRAIHLEVAHSLDTSSFICALRRLVARRGSVRRLRSDNGTNFVGSNRELRKAIEDWNKIKIQHWCQQNAIEWVFQPPASSHHGGVFEREIRTIRKVLSGLMNEQPMNFSDETLRTLFCEIEAILNGRPLTEVSSDPDDMEALTPNHLLLLNSDVKFPPGLFTENDLYTRKRWKQVQYLSDVFWSRWQKEYLPLLQSRQKWTCDREPHRVGDLVLVMNNLLPRNHWSMGRISETHRDKQGRVRSVKIKIAKYKDNSVCKFGNIEIERPITKIILLKTVNELNKM